MFYVTIYQQQSDCLNIFKTFFAELWGCALKAAVLHQLRSDVKGNKQLID